MTGHYLQITKGDFVLLNFYDKFFIKIYDWLEKKKVRIKSHLDSELMERRGIKLPSKPGGWSIGYDDIIFIDKEIERFLQRETINVLEFGSGLSTFSIISRLERSFKGRYRFCSFEADLGWYNKTKQGINSFFPDAGFVKINHVVYSCPDGGGLSFDLGLLLSDVDIGSFDFVFVDAPPDTNGENVRLNLCLRLIKFISPKGVLILHDTKRINELYATTVLGKFFALTESYETEKGITVFRFPSEGICQSFVQS